MEAYQLNSAVLTYTDNVDPTDGDYAARRARIHQYQQEVVDEVWNFRDWTFKQRSATVTGLTGNNFILLPYFLAELGDLGGIFKGTIEYQEVDPTTLIRCRSLGVVDFIFSIFSQATTSGDAWVRKAQFVETFTANTNLTLHYSAGPPLLIDTLGDESSKSLRLIPEQYHNTVILPGVIAKANTSKGDTRDFMQQYIRGLNLMVLRERPRKTMIQRIPAAVRNW